MGHEKHEKTRKKKVTTEHTENTEVEPQMNTDRHESGKTTENTEVGFAGLVGLFEQTQTAMQSQAARSVDIALVVRNWLFGWYIVEYQQSGSDRAEYEFPPGTGGSGESIHFDITVSGGDGGGPYMRLVTPYKTVQAPYIQRITPYIPKRRGYAKLSLE